jgi:hypothetical protein
VRRKLAKMPWPRQSACTMPWAISSGYMAVGTPKNFGIFCADLWLRRITATTRGCLSDDWSEIVPLIYTRTNTITGLLQRTNWFSVSTWSQPF